MITPSLPFLLFQKALEREIYPNTFKSKPFFIASSVTSSISPAGISPALLRSISYSPAE